MQLPLHGPDSKQQILHGFEGVGRIVWHREAHHCATLMISIHGAGFLCHIIHTFYYCEVQPYQEYIHCLSHFSLSILLVSSGSQRVGVGGVLSVEIVLGEGE